MISVEAADDNDSYQNNSTGDLGVPTSDLRRHIFKKNSKPEHCNSMWTVNPSVNNNNNNNKNGAYPKGINGKSLDDLRHNGSTLCIKRRQLSSSRPSMPDGSSETPAQKPGSNNLAYLREPLRKQNIFYSASTVNLAQTEGPEPAGIPENEESVAGVQNVNLKEESEVEGMGEASRIGSVNEIHKRLHPNRFLGGILQMLGFEVFKDPCFILLLITSVIIFFGLFTFFFKNSQNLFKINFRVRFLFL